MLGPAMRRVQHGSVWRLVLFNTFTSDLEKVIQSTLIRLADDSKLGDADNKLQGRATILRNTDRPEKEAPRKGPVLKRICGYQWRRG